LEPLDRRVLKGIVRRHNGDRGVGNGEKAWTCERHLKALLFGQFTGLDSLRQITEGLTAHAASFYHLNLRTPHRSTLADANQARPAQVFRDIAAALLPLAAGTLGRADKAAIRLLDATPIPLRDLSFSWAEASARTRGLKLHVLFDSRRDCLTWFDLTSAKVDDVVAGRAVPLEAGTSYVFDKGYTDYRWWAQLVDAKAFFVTRKKRNARCRDIVERKAEGDGILADRFLKIGHRQPRGGAPKNPLYDVCLREVVVARPDPRPDRSGLAAEPLSLLTNDLHRPAVEIAALYKERWQIELLFRWLKQNLKIRHFLGRSENAVRIQIYVALIAFLLLRLLHHTAARAFKPGATLLLARLKTALLDPLDLRNKHPPTPRPPAWRPPPAQHSFPFP
jgi:IS4 transposase